MVYLAECVGACLQIKVLSRLRQDEWELKAKLNYTAKYCPDLKSLFIQTIGNNLLQTNGIWKEHRKSTNLTHSFKFSVWILLDFLCIAYISKLDPEKKKIGILIIAT